MAELDPVEQFEEFLKSYRTKPGKTPYREQLQTLSAERQISVQIDFGDLLKSDPQLAKNVQSNPSRYLEVAGEAIRNVMKIIDEEYLEEVPEFHARIFNLPSIVPLRQIRAKHIGHFIQVSGILTRATEVKPLLRIGVFRCRRCGEEIEVIQEGYTLTKPEVCPNTECKRIGPFTEVSEKSEFRDWQKIGIQERPEELPAGQLPRTVNAILLDDLVDQARPGDRVNIIGVLHSYPDASTRSKSTVFFSQIEANNLVLFEPETRGIEITPTDEKEIKKQAKDPFVIQNIARSISPSIYGNEDVKEALALLLFGGVAKVMPDGTRIRGEPNILLVGDPGTAKSQLLKYIANLAPRALFTSGRGSTAAGLTAAVMRDPDTGGMTLEAGALVLADLGIACLDEFDKMRKEDAVAIHEAMEQHTVSIAKAGIVATLNARTAILAAANPAFGKYNEFKTPAQNLTLPVTVMSRFDLIFVMTDKPDEKTDRQLSGFVLDLHRKKGETLEPPFEMDFLRKYVAYAKQNVQPVLSKDAADKIQEFYLKMREMGKGPDAALPITPRQLESLIRLTEARAKMALRSKCLVEDAEAVIRLMDAALRKVAYDYETDQIDIGRITLGAPKSQLERIQQVLGMVIRLQVDDPNGAPITKILEEATGAGIEEATVRSILTRLLNEGTVFSPRSGFYKKS
ncbi:MAG: minichromosome maintenance protein MCM [Candidatus Ranarchaeia archaeon]|jgi:replicative DNA helicase Mcm